MTRYDAGVEQEIYELFLSKVKENSEKFGIKWTLQIQNLSSYAVIRTEDGRH